MPRKRKALPVLNPHIYRVLSDAVEVGVTFGWNRAYKHTDTPTPDLVKEKIHEAVMNECSEWFHFPDPYEIQ